MKNNRKNKKMKIDVVMVGYIYRWKEKKGGNRGGKFGDGKKGG